MKTPATHPLSCNGISSRRFTRRIRSRKSAGSWLTPASPGSMSIRSTRSIWLPGALLQRRRRHIVEVQQSVEYELMLAKSLPAIYRVVDEINDSAFSDRRVDDCRAIADLVGAAHGSGQHGRVGALKPNQHGRMCNGTVIHNRRIGCACLVRLACDGKERAVGPSHRNVLAGITE